MTMPTYTAAEAKRMIRAKSVSGEYAVTGWLDLGGCDLSGATLPTTVTGSLDLRGCDLTGVTLPTTVGVWLYLGGCDLTGVTLPTTVGGSLDLGGCDLSGVTLPTTVGGSLDLLGCDLSGVTLPTTVGGSLDLGGCDLSGATLPTTVTGSLDLRGIKPIATPSTWYSQNGGATKRRVVASDGEYALVQLDNGGWVAGCRKFNSTADALAHWSRLDARAVLFTAKIKEFAA